MTDHGRGRLYPWPANCRRSNNIAYSLVSTVLHTYGAEVLHVINACSSIFYLNPDVLHAFWVCFSNFENQISIVFKAVITKYNCEKDASYFS